MESVKSHMTGYDCSQPHESHSSFNDDHDANYSFLKTGRRGDPRMHRAVAARLSDPSISLFEALRIGGFEYANDDSANLVDSENVTLGQRKNQLSRRVRLAKRQSDIYKENEKEQPGPSESQNSQMATIHHQETCEGDIHLHHNYHCVSNHSSSGSPHTDDEDSSDEHESNHNCSSQSRKRNRCRVAPNSTVGKSSKEQKSLANSEAEKINGITIKTQHDHNVSTFTAVNPVVSFHGSPEISSSSCTKPNDVIPDVPPAEKTNSTIDDAIAAAEKAAGELAAALHQCGEQIQTSLGGDLNIARQELAMGLYQAENRALYQRAMLLTGYPPNSALKEWASLDYLAFALNCWQAEGERLTSLIKNQQRRKELNDAAASLHLEEKRHSVEPHSHQCSGTRAEWHPDHSKCSGKSLRKKTDDCVHHDHMPHSHERIDGTGADHSCPLTGGRHIHRLEGKCGHQAILHIPEDGPAHIDFVVGNKVECYQGMQPVSYQNSADTTIWPSAYKCGDLGSCAGLCSDDVLASHKHTEKCCQNVDPKILYVDDIDMESKEWNLEFPFGETLLGLFKLGDANGNCEPTPLYDLV